MDYSEEFELLPIANNKEIIDISHAITACNSLEKV